MTLDLILYRPEFFLIFGFFVLLWSGTGNLVTPVKEILILTSRNTLRKKERKNLFLNSDRFSQLKRKRSLKGPSHVSFPLTLWAIVWCLLSFFSLFFTPLYSVFLGGSFQKDSYTVGLSLILFRTRSLVFRVSLSWQKSAGICQSEYIYLALLAAIGGYLLIMSTDLMSLYLCMELQSFSLVVLCGANSKSAFSLEAAIKYFLLSAFRSCFTLLGIGFVYWELGETSLPNIEILCKRTRNAPTLSTTLGIWFISIGLLWKLAVAPLHFWVPDVYMGAWSSVSLWITLLPKIAVLGFWTRHWRTLWNIFFGGESFLSLFRALSLLVGRIAPLAQKDMKRLLSYSSIGHIGILLLPLCIAGVHAGTAQRTGFEENRRVLWVYMLLYIVINLGTWGLILWPTYRPLSSFVSEISGIDERKNEKRNGTNTSNVPAFAKGRTVEGISTGGSRTHGNAEQNRTSSRTSVRTSGIQHMPLNRCIGLTSVNIPVRGVAIQYIWDLKGLNKSSRRAAFRWAVFIRSFAGIPPAYSFLGKRRILWQRINKELYFLVFVVLIYTIVRSVYYLKIIQISYVEKSPTYRSYGPLSSLPAYIIAASAFTILLGLWIPACGNFVFLRSSLLALCNS